jgi:signal peptidase I
LTPAGAVRLIRPVFTGFPLSMATRKLERRSSGLLDNIKTVIYAGLIALVIRTAVAEPFDIPSGSMIPTLLIGDYLFVSKFSYGYSRYSLPLSPPLFSGRIFGSLPRRGDVAVFKLPRDPSIDYIKRIIGLPGDTIQMKDGQLYINGAQVPRTPDGDYTDDSEGPPIILRRYIETLPNGVKHPILKASDDGPLDNTPEYHVPPGCVFAMGDNRDNSQDSRVLNAVGYIPVENLVGRAEVLFFSIDGTAPWWQVWEWPFEIRWSRILAWVR